MDQLAGIDQFVDGLISEKFQDSPVDDQTRAEIKKELTDKLNHYITLRTIDAISTTTPEAIDELHTLIKTDPDPKNVQAFIADRVKEPDVLVAQILADFKSLYIGDEKLSN